MLHVHSRNTDMEDSMPWNEATGRIYTRDGKRHPSDSTDEEWELIEPLLPAPPTRGRPHTTEMRDVADALPCIAKTGCQRRHLPKGFPFFTTVQYCFCHWRDSGVYAGIIDCQSVKATESGGPSG